MINSKSASEMRKKAEKATKESFWVEKIISLIDEKACRGEMSLDYYIPIDNDFTKDDVDKIVDSLKCLGYIINHSHVKHYIGGHSSLEEADYYYYQSHLHISW